MSPRGWTGRDDHALSIVDGRGRQVHRTSVPHTSAGLRDLVRALRRHGACEVAIERPDGPVVDALLAARLTVVVISPNQVKNLRGRYGSAGNKDDRYDAYVLADTLRTDRARLRPLVPDTEAIDSEISLAFLARFSTQDRADWLTPKRLGDWLAKQGYSDRTDPAVLRQPRSFSRAADPE